MVAIQLPTSILFCCDFNAVRSPMAEGIMKKIYGNRTYIQSAGVRSDLDINGYAVSVCHEIGIELSRHRTRAMHEMREFGDDLASFELIVALSPAAQKVASEHTRYFALDLEYWPVLDPTGMAEKRDENLLYFRKTRDQIMNKILERFGEPEAS
ncbi:MAG: low molecular weight phosphatase family protein [Rhodobacteraceae bacterium]|nr:low molecular weight phosphatase family protein [Paracoccaceae bacterium]